MTISGGRTEQLDIFCRVTGFMSDFLSFIVVEHIQFFHAAIHLCVSDVVLPRLSWSKGRLFCFVFIIFLIVMKIEFRFYMSNHSGV